MNERFFMGRPCDFKGLCKVYPPKLNEILDNPNVMIYESLLTMQQEDIDNLLTNNGEELIKPDMNVPTPLEYLIINAYGSEESFNLIQKAFKFFIHEDVLFDFETMEVILGVDLDIQLDTDQEKLDYLKSLNRLGEENFHEFQNLVRSSMGGKEIKPFNYNIHPRARRMLDRARYRDAIKNKKDKDGISLATIMSSICLMDCGINPLNIGELTYAAINDLFMRYQEKTQYETDLMFMTIPFADTKSIKPKYWIRNLNES